MRILNVCGSFDEGKYITKIAQRVSDKTDNDARKLRDVLAEVIHLLDGVRIGCLYGADIPSILEIDRTNERIAPLCNEIIEETAKAKISLTDLSQKS